MVCSLIKMWQVALLLGQLCLHSLVTTAIPTKFKELVEKESADVKTVAFWHVAHVHPGESADAKLQETQQTMNEQYNVIMSSQLYDRMDDIFYFTSGHKLGALTLPAVQEKFTKFQLDPEQKLYPYTFPTEIDTLSYLFDYCNKNANSKVLYFHTPFGIPGTQRKNAASETRLRRSLDCFTLNPHCIDALDDHDTCGWRLSAHPYVHYIGNFWWAKCQYINRLVHPKVMFTNDLFAAENNAAIRQFNARHFPNDISMSSEGVHIHRYGMGFWFAESWMASHPFLKPADCMSENLDNSYTGGTEVPSYVLMNNCPNYNTPQGALGLDYTVASYGSPCSTSTVASEQHSKLKKLLLPQNHILVRNYEYDKSLVNTFSYNCFSGSVSLFSTLTGIAYEEESNYVWARARFFVILDPSASLTCRTTRVFHRN
jgi:hypothetical protein